MNLPRVFLLSALVCLPCVAAEQSRFLFLKFPAKDVAALSHIDRLVITVSCSWIGSLKNVPELYDIRMGYDMPTENVFEAAPRLGAAAVDLARWNGVIGVRIPPDADAKSCFSVKATAESSFNNATRHWDGQQLGLPK